MGEGSSWKFELLTHRTETTINAYLKFVKDCMRYMGAEKSPFLLPALKKYQRGSKRMALSEGYALSTKAHKGTEAPAYISVDEYRAS